MAPGGCAADGAGGGWHLGGGCWAAGQAWPPSQPSGTHTRSVNRLEASMPKFTRTLAVGATLAVVTLAGMASAAHAQATDEPTRHVARRPPTQGQVGEAWRHRQAVTPEQATADTAHRRQMAQERSYNPTTTPAPVPVPVPAPARADGRQGWVTASLGVLAVLLVVGLSVLGVRRARRRAPPPAASLTR
jgi:hypothetical protein